MSKNIFSNQQQKIFRDKTYFYVFYTVLLYLMALTVTVISQPHEICFTSYLCADSAEKTLAASFILYLYLLIFAVIIIYSFKVLEKVLQHKKHLLIFRSIFIAIPLLAAVYVWLTETYNRNSLLLILFTAILSVAGLLMIELRKKKN